MEYPIYESSRELTLCIPMEDIVSADLQSMIEEYTTKEVTALHNGEGIILPESVNVLTRSSLFLNPKDSTYKVIVRYKAMVVDTPNGSELNAKVESVLSSGLLCHVYHSQLPSPIIRVYVPLTIHTAEDQTRISGIRKNDIIRVRSINRKGSYADKIITTLASFVDLVERPEEKIVVSKDLPAPANESEYDAKGDGDPVGPQAEGMAPMSPDDSREEGELYADVYDEDEEEEGKDEEEGEEEEEETVADEGAAQ